MWNLKNLFQPKEAEPNEPVSIDLAQPAAVHAIGKDEIARATQLLKRYKSGKANLESRIIDNEKWYKMQHWEQIRSKNPGDPEPASAWLFNCIANKHADAMDNYPAPNVLPREQSDDADAKLLSAILPVVLEQNDFEQTYNDVWWYKLKMGTGVYGVTWDSKKQNGLGDIDIKSLDLLNLYWEPGVLNIQDSPNFFVVDLADKEQLSNAYPQLEYTSLADAVDVAKYRTDETIDTTEKTVVVDWYYKRSYNGKTVVHYCKFCAGEVLYATENDPQYAERGLYDHGKYPIVFDVLFPEAGSPAGFGYIEVGKSPQMYIDKLDQVILKHSVMGARPRFFVRGDGKINETEYADWSKDFVHYSGAGDPNDHIMPIVIPNLSESYVSVRSLKIDELKETSGNRDFAQGGTSSGVTSGVAIASLQEAGSKLSRDMIKSAYRAFAEVNYLCLELMRQFYTEDRYFRVVGPRGETQFMMFNGRQIAAKPIGNAFGMDQGFRMPIFDIKITSQKSSPFSTIAQNERAKELYGMGFFRPDLADQALAALDMMDFEGIEKVRDRISQNGMLYQQLQQALAALQQMTAIVDATQGTNLSQGVTQAQGMGAETPAASGAKAEPETNALGAATRTARSSTAGAARQRVASAASPK